LRDAGASRWSAMTFFGHTTKLVLDSGGLLMEAARVSERLKFTNVLPHSNIAPHSIQVCFLECLSTIPGIMSFAIAGDDGTSAIAAAVAVNEYRARIRI